MFLRKLAGFGACALMVSLASLATGGVPDLSLSTVTAYAGPETPVMLNLPNGGGSAFTTASIIGGTVDATITLTLLDGAMAPVVGFPRADLWLETTDPAQEFSFGACPAGTIADVDTDATGTTQWALPLAAGGASQTETLVMINGSALTSNGGLSLHHNSADINADGVVNLSDAPLFASDFFGGENPFRSDFQYDGMVNLSDVVKLAQGLGAGCP